jgi:transcriptional regulator with XRE-family HTH domain
VPVPNPPSRIRLRRWILGLTLDDLSEQTGIDVGTLSKIERGKRGGGTPEQLKKIRRALKDVPDSLAAPPAPPSRPPSK